MGVSIKKDQLKNNMSSLHLYIFIDGKEWRENLKLRVYDKPSSSVEKEHNRKTLALAESIKAKKTLEYQDEKYNVVTGFKSQGSFLKYFKSLMDARRKSEGNYGNWKSTYKHLLDFCNGRDARFSDVNDDFLNKFKHFLINGKLTKSQTDLSTNSASSYFNKLKAALNQAYIDRIIADNPGTRVKGVKLEDKRRNYLLFEEVSILNKVECRVPVLKKAFIFSCLTGLRWSDINKLKWGDFIYSEAEKKWKINYTQKKSKTVQYHPISNQAFNLLGERRDTEEKVFKGLKYSAWNNHILAEWIWKDAGIQKAITFHCARHTYATSLLSHGADIFTVSSLLGHKEIKTTQIYTNVVDTKKNSVVDLIPDLAL